MASEGGVCVRVIAIAADAVCDSDGRAATTATPAPSDAALKAAEGSLQDAHGMHG